MQPCEPKIIFFICGGLYILNSVKSIHIMNMQLDYIRRSNGSKQRIRGTPLNNKKK